MQFCMGVHCVIILANFVIMSNFIWHSLSGTIVIYYRLQRQLKQYIVKEFSSNTYNNN